MSMEEKPELIKEERPHTMIIVVYTKGIKSLN